VLKMAAEKVVKYMHPGFTIGDEALVSRLEDMPTTIQQHCEATANSAAGLCLATAKAHFPKIDPAALEDGFPQGVESDDAMQLFNDMLPHASIVAKKLRIDPA
jgi:DNA-binding transcriptional regulator YdaS (Cro superfamily)